MTAVANIPALARYLIDTDGYAEQFVGLTVDDLAGFLDAHRRSWSVDDNDDVQFGPTFFEDLERSAR